MEGATVGEDKGSSPDLPVNGVNGANLWPRRRVLKAIAATGIGSALFGRALVTLAQDEPEVNKSMIKKAEWISGLTLTDDDRKMMIEGVNEALAGFAALRKVTIDNGVAPALQFNPDPAGRQAAAVTRRAPVTPRATGMKRPTSDEDLAFVTRHDARVAAARPRGLVRRADPSLPRTAASATTRSSCASSRSPRSWR